MTLEKKTKMHKDENQKRGNWASQSEFLLSMIGYSVGYGNLWRFPYLCIRNGGGAFLIPYFIFLILCGIPLFFLELSIGQFANLSPLAIWKVCPLFKGIGWSMLTVSAVCCVYFNVITAWVLFYLGSSFTASLPWIDCSNSWNTPLCAKRGIYNSSITYLNSTDEGNVTSISPLLLLTANKSMKTPSEEFWQHKALELTSGIHNLSGMRWELLICHIVSWTLVFLCVSKSVKSVGKVVWVTATTPFILLTVLLVRGLTLPGALNGIKLYLYPDFSRLLEFNVWGEACLQIFYSLGPAWGGITTMASYNKFHNNCLRDSILIPFINCGTSFFAGFVIFTVIGFMAHEVDLPVSKVITSGPGLAFIAYPEAIAKLPISPFWAILFFFMLLTLGLDSVFGMVETIASGICDEFNIQKKKRMLVSLIVCIMLLLLGIPITTKGGMYIFQLLDWYAAAFSVMIIALLECLVLAYGYGWKRMYCDIEMMLGYRPNYVWSICWRFITPAIMMVIIVLTSVKMGPPTYGEYTYPHWAVGIGWTVAMLSVIPMPLIAVIQLARTKGNLLQRIRHLIKPTEDWGPAVEKYRIRYKYGKNQAMEAQMEDPLSTESKL